MIDRVLGSRLDAGLAEPLHRLAHRGQVDTLILPASDLARRRFRATSRAGTEVTVALPRDQKLFDGAVLLLAPERALVVSVDAQRWLRLRPASVAEGVELGYHAGNLHWRVRFEGSALLVALEAPVDSYLDRLSSALGGRSVAHDIVDDA